MPTWWTVRPAIVNARIRRVTSALARMLPRGVETLIQPVLPIRFSAASSGLISTKHSGWSSVSHGFQRLMAPAR
jgi:hypothetical protein